MRVKETDYIIVGLEDGSLHIYNLSKNIGQSYTIPKTAGSTKPLRSTTHSPYDIFIESNYEHHDAIVSIEIQGSSVVTASKDGTLMMWTLEARDDDDEDDMLKFDSELDMKSLLTKAKWLSHDEILVSTTSGELMSVIVKSDVQQVPFLEKASKVYFRTDSAIMDFAFCRSKEDQV